MIYTCGWLGLVDNEVARHGILHIQLMIPVTLSKLEIGRQVELKVDHVSAVTLQLYLYSLRIPVGQSLLIACVLA